MKNFTSLRLFLCTMLLVLTAGTAWADNVTDTLTSGASCFNVGSSYTTASYTGPSGATYSASMAGGNSSIQLRSTNHSGIVTTASGGKVKSISITWNSSTDAARTVDVYGSNTAYTAPSDLYSTETRGTKLGSQKKSDGNGTIIVKGDYAFIGIRSSSGAMYISEITVVWEPEGSPSKEDAVLEYSATSATVDMAEAATFTFPVLDNPASLPVSYKSTNTNVATIDANGNVTLVGKGTTTIKADSEETETYYAGSTSYTLFVTDYDHTYWSEDWSGENPLSNYELSSTGYVAANDNLAGGTAPELLIRTAETLTYTADVQGHKGALTIEFRSNRNSVAFSTTTSGVTIGKATAIASATTTGQLYSQEITLESTVKYVELVLTNGNSQNARVDNIILYGDYDPNLIVVDTRTATSIAFSETNGYTTRLDSQGFSVQATVNDKDGAPVNGATVTYTSLNEDIAIVDETTGVITPKAVGTATIKATYAGDENYIESNGKITLKVTYPYTHAGSQADPFTVEEAIEKAKENGTTSDGVIYYTTGIISQVDNYNSNYNSIQYWISDDGETTKQLEVYGGKNINGTNFTSIDDLAVGYTVTVAGELKMYNTTTPEYDKDNYLVAIDKHDAVAAPTFSVAEGTYTEAQTVTITAETGLTIIYTTDGENPKTAATATTTSGNTATVTVDATMTLRAVAFDGTNYSIETSATYTIIDPSLVDATYTFTDADWVEQEGYTNAASISSWIVDNVAIGGDKGTGNYPPAYYTSNGGNLRVYNNNRFVVASTNGTPITSIVMVCSNSTYAHITLPEGQPGTLTLDGATYTWTPATNDVVSVTFSGDGNSRISTLTVTTKSNITVTEDVTISSAGFGTLYTNRPFEVPAGMTAGIINATSGADADGIATLTIDWAYPESTIAPAATPLLIKGAEGNYTYTCKGTTEATPASNLLMGSAATVETYGGDLYYMLSYGTGDKANTLGFFWGAANGGAFTSAAGKCWLTTSASSGIRGFVFNLDDTTTGINNVNTATNSQTIFDLQGRRVNTPAKGVYIINGKKVLVK